MAFPSGLSSTSSLELLGFFSLKGRRDCELTFLIVHVLKSERKQRVDDSPPGINLIVMFLVLSWNNHTEFSCSISFSRIPI